MAANNNSKTPTWLVVVVIILLLGALGSCSESSSSDSYRDTLDSGLKKYYNNEKMNKQEHDAVESFNKWKHNNSDHKYNDW